MQFNDSFFEELGKSAGVERLTKAAAEKVASAARSSAPVDTGDYKRRLVVVKKQSSKRTVYLVKGTDPKTMLIESKTGNLARSLRTLRRG